MRASIPTQRKERLMAKQKIKTFLWYDAQAEEAALERAAAGQ